MSVLQALDEARFGPERTLNLRATLPSAQQASERVERWLRQHQMQRTGEVLVITGRGNNSPGGVSPVRERVHRQLRLLKRRGVVADFSEHTAGSFVVRLAPIRALLATATRRDDRPTRRPDPDSLAALGDDTRALLRRLAHHALVELGVRDPEPFLGAEMLRQFSRLAAGIPQGPNREPLLHNAIAHALDESGDR